MPLPTTNQPWPPPDQADALRLYARYGAWYSGDPELLTQVYADTPGTGSPTSLGTELPTGQVPAPRFLATIQRGIQRMFWGQPPSVGQIRGHKLHIPLAGDIAGTSAEMLFGEPPTATLGPTSNKATQDRLDKILDEANGDAFTLELAETAAVYGGAYGRIRWDPIIADCPLLDVIPPDAAVPEWRGTNLVAVTFWRDLERVDGKWWRHLERHEPGVILHGLYMSGDEGKLGRPMDLVDHPATSPFAVLVDAGSNGISTGARGLTAEYVPNMRPNRTLRGSALGRSDYAGGVEALFDALDEAWTSWMRDLRIGKGRLIVPRSYLQSSGRGKGAHFDPEREIFEQVDALTSPDGGLAMQVVQFEIRVEQHKATCSELTSLALRSAGYSAQTYGEQGDIAQTATEVTARQEQSFRTRAKKIVYMRGPIARLYRTLLEVDATKFGTPGIRPDLPVLEWPDGVAVDPQDQATTLQLLAAAEAASIRTRVGMLHPEWDDQDIDEEVTRIKGDTAPPVQLGPPGATATGHGPDGPEPAGPPPTGPGDPGPAGGKPAATPAKSTAAGATTNGK